MCWPAFSGQFLQGIYESKGARKIDVLEGDREENPYNYGILCGKAKGVYSAKKVAPQAVGVVEHWSIGVLEKGKILTSK